MNKLPYSLLIATSLLISNPTQAQSSNKINNNQNAIEMMDNSDILSNITKRTWTEIPGIYKKKLEDFFSSNKNMKDPELWKFTEDFIVEQMNKNPWMDNTNRLIFLLDLIYEKNTWKNIYEWEDWDEKRLNDFEEYLDTIEETGNTYVKLIKEYTQKLFEKYDEQSAKAREQSAKAREQSAKSLTSSLENLARFYNRYKKDPSTIKDEEVRQRKEKGNEVILRCKEEEIDYKLKLSPEMLKFYGVE